MPATEHHPDRFGSPRFFRAASKWPWRVLLTGSLLLPAVGCRQVQKAIAQRSTSGVPVRTVSHRPTIGLRTPIVRPGTSGSQPQTQAEPVPSPLPEPDKPEPSPVPSVALAEGTFLSSGRMSRLGGTLIEPPPQPTGKILASSAQLEWGHPFGSPETLRTFLETPPSVALSDAVRKTLREEQGDRSLSVIGQTLLASIDRVPGNGIRTGAELTFDPNIEGETKRTTLRPSIPLPGTGPLLVIPETVDPTELPAPESVRATVRLSLPQPGRSITVADPDRLLIAYGRKVGRVTDRKELTEIARLREPYGVLSRPDGRLLVCDADARAVFEVDPDSGTTTKVLTEVEGTRLRRPVALADDGFGGYYVIDAGFEGIMNPIGKVIHVSLKGTATVVAKKLDNPTRIVTTPNRDRLLVLEPTRERILTFSIQVDRTLTARKVLVDLAYEGNGLQPNGLTIDDAGQIYLASRSEGAIVVLSKTGEIRQRYPVPDVDVRGLVLTGKAGRQLLLTGTKLNNGARTTEGVVIELDLLPR